MQITLKIRNIQTVEINQIKYKKKIKCIRIRNKCVWYKFGEKSSIFS